MEKNVESEFKDINGNVMMLTPVEKAFEEFGHGVTMNDLVWTAETLADYEAAQGAPTEKANYQGFEIWEWRRRGDYLVVLDAGDNRYVSPPNDPAIFRKSLHFD